MPGNSEKKEKSGCDLLRQERSFKNTVERERFLGLRVAGLAWASREHVSKTEKRLPANPFNLWGQHSVLPSVVSEKTWAVVSWNS